MVVLREVFAFAIGLAVMISISSLFANDIAPDISRMSVSVQLSSVFSHVNALLAEAESLINEEDNNLTVIADMPSMIGPMQFRVYTSANQLCVKTFGQFILLRCGELRLNSSVNGNYLSGSQLQINCFNNETGRFISFRNKL